MKLQNFEKKNQKIRDAFAELKGKQPEKLKRRLNLSWSNWGFGMEPLADSAARLEKAGITFIELHGNHYGPDLGYKPAETLKILGDHGIKVGGVCGMFSADNDLSSNRALHRQAAINYLKREIPFTRAVGGTYLLVVPGAVGRAAPYDHMEFERSVETLRIVADLFVQHKVLAAVEPIRAAEVSLVNTIADAQRYIKAVDHPGVAHINGDVYHMQVEETHIAGALVDAGPMLTNLHMADTNRGTLGSGIYDLDSIIAALYAVGYNNESCFCTCEPLGPGGDVYRAMHGHTPTELLDILVLTSARYWRERETQVRAAAR